MPRTAFWELDLDKLVKCLSIKKGEHAKLAKVIVTLFNLGDWRSAGSRLCLRDIQEKELGGNDGGHSTEGWAKKLKNL